MRCLFVVVSLTCAAPVLAGEASVADRYRAWQSCLNASIARQPAGLPHAGAVKAALAACGRSETAYLETLAASPLFGAGEIDAARDTIRSRAEGTLMIAARDRLDPVATGSIDRRRP